jgi:hypothetical protein
MMKILIFLGVYNKTLSVIRIEFLRFEEETDSKAYFMDTPKT